MGKGRRTTSLTLAFLALVIAVSTQMACFAKDGEERRGPSRYPLTSEGHTWSRSCGYKLAASLRRPAAWAVRQDSRCRGALSEEWSYCLASSWLLQSSSSECSSFFVELNRVAVTRGKLHEQCGQERSGSPSIRVDVTVHMGVGMCHAI